MCLGNGDKDSAKNTSTWATAWIVVLDGYQMNSEHYLIYLYNRMIYRLYPGIQRYSMTEYKDKLKLMKADENKKKQLLEILDIFEWSIRE